MDSAAIKNFVLSAKRLLTQSANAGGHDENAAYFAFMRIAAVHYMRVNGFLPLHFTQCGFEGVCGALSEYLPELFCGAPQFKAPYNDINTGLQKISKAFVGNPEIIGELHRYFVAEQRENAFLLLQKNIRVSKNDLPAATQIFTPRWIVEYLVQNSLGAFCVSPPKGWKYRINARRQTAKDAKEIKLIDPCMGSGNILLYAFDVFIRLYKEAGIQPDDAAAMILQHNIYGLEIDKKAYTAACFSLMMKARSYDDNIFEKGFTHNLCEIREDSGTFKNAKLYGSLIKVETPSENTLFAQQAAIMSQQYDVVITNPPYMGRKSLNAELSAFLRTHYPHCKSELYSAFISACLRMTKEKGLCAMITLHTWMFISSFEKLRKYILQNTQILSMLHAGAATFDGLNAFNALSVAFCLKKQPPEGVSVFIRLTEYLSEKEKIINFGKANNRFVLNQKNFGVIPKSPFIYWLNGDMRAAFINNGSLGSCCKPVQGLATGDNKKFVRRWYEVDRGSIGFDSKSISDFHASGKLYAPYNKGGGFRKWYGSNDFVIKFDKNSFDLLLNQGNNLPSRQYYFKEGITWSLFGFENFSVRYKPRGFVFDVSGSSLFPAEKTKYILAFLSSKVAFSFLSAIAPTVNFQVGNIASLPFKFDKTAEYEVERLADENIALSKDDWDGFERSWDFISHPLAKRGRLFEIFEQWENICQRRYNKVLANEILINEIFAKIYSVNIDADVQSRDISVSTADLRRDISSLMSYALGSMFGRFGGGRQIDILSIGDIADGFIEFAGKTFGETDNNLAFIAKALCQKHKSPADVIFDYYKKTFFRDHLKAYKNCPIYWRVQTKDFDGFLYIHNYNSDTAKKFGCKAIQGFEINKQDEAMANYQRFLRLQNGI